MKFFLLVFTKITAFPFLWLFFKPKIKGLMYLKETNKPLLIIANHISRWDPVLLHILIPTKELQILSGPLKHKNKVLIWFLSIFGVYAMNHSSVAKTIEDSVSLLNKPTRLLIFPEGRINKSFESIKRGAAFVAFEARTNILPVYIDGNYGVFRRVGVHIGKPFTVDNSVEKSDSKTVAVSKINALLQIKIQELIA